MIAHNKKYGLSYDDYIIASILLYTVKILRKEYLIYIGHYHFVFVVTRIVRSN